MPWVTNIHEYVYPPAYYQVTRSSLPDNDNKTKSGLSNGFDKGS